MDEITSAFPIINDRYQILNTISSGGMAVIYRAKDIILDRDTALKILKRDLSQKNDFRDQFSKEAKSSARLTHPNIVTTYDFGLYGDRLYIAMELIDGQLLKDIIPNDNISFETRFDYIKQACQGLSYAHKNRIIHCDIKPQNMLVSNAGEVKLTDFGISRAIDSVSREGQTDEIWGSPYYIAPEIAKGESPSPASDIYSFGIVMYEVFTKQLPFNEDDVLSLIEKHLEGQPPPPIKLNPQIPPALNEIILRAIEKDPKKRFLSAGELFLALEKFENHENQIFTDDNGRIIREDKNREDELNSVNQETQIDWKTILLGFLALITVGGLIPFWLFIYYSINR